MARSDEWATPLDVYEKIREEFGPFTLDPCATAENTKCPRWFGREADGLAQSWHGERVFMNPPFSAVSRWIQKGRREAFAGAYVVALVAARTGSEWWHRDVQDVATRVVFLRGRIKFSGAVYNAPFDCALVIYETTSVSLAGMAQ